MCQIVIKSIIIKLIKSLIAIVWVTINRHLKCHNRDSPTLHNLFSFHYIQVISTLTFHEAWSLRVNYYHCCLLTNFTVLFESCINMTTPDFGLFNQYANTLSWCHKLLGTHWQLTYGNSEYWTGDFVAWLCWLHLITRPTCHTGFYSRAANIILFTIIIIINYYYLFFI